MKTYTLNRQIKSEDTYDVVVLGGGPSGSAAAIQAARLGAKTLLVEAGGCLGGMGTAALVSNWYATGDQEKLIVGGLIVEWIEALAAQGALPPGLKREDWQTGKRGIGFNAETLKRLLDEQCVAAGVEVRFMTKLIDLEVDQSSKTIHGVILHSVEGYQHVPAKMVIDATGDAVGVDLAGAACRRAGVDTEKIMPPTLCSIVTQVDFDRFDRRTMQQPAVERALEEGYFSQPDRHVPGLFRAGGDWGTLNAGHIFNMDALNQESLSKGLMRGRELAEEYTAFFRDYLPGCENAQNIATAQLMGIRESRRIVGEYELNYADYKGRRHFNDQIAVYCKQVDIHVYDLSQEEYERYYKEFNEEDTFNPGESYGIPYGILVPRGWKNLWAPGRACSSDIKVNGAIRDQPACAMMGQAAGAAAVQALRTGQVACDINTEELITTLRDQGAYLPQEDLTQTMTRNEIAV